MKVVIAIDSFKGSLSSIEAGNAVAHGIKRVYPDADVIVSPIADGGEGLIDAIMLTLNCQKRTVKVHDPLFRTIESHYVISENTAFIEMAAASGLTLLSPEERNPMHTSTFGTGELIKDAIDQGIRRFVVGIGGSATNDGGVGMLSALGIEFLDKSGNIVSPGAKGLENLTRIRFDNACRELCECTFKVACDVKNPLCGANGCSAIFGPQKGADDEMIEKMDAWLHNYASLTKEYIPSADPNIDGSGAAGGLGFAFCSFLGATLVPGIDLIIKETNLEEQVKNADIIITGEGRLDSQSCMGKAPIGVAKLAKKYGKIVLAFSGSISSDASVCNHHGIDAFFPAVRKPCSLTEAMNKENAKCNLADTAEQVFKVIKAVK
ncbi:MAG: glycerate kinase [Ruminococcaceae bacterium]|nr:glycerate kinase [Oscillospiraceae bacterium]